MRSDWVSGRAMFVQLGRGGGKKEFAKRVDPCSKPVRRGVAAHSVKYGMVFIR
jgi:hypothetical protein